MTAITPSLPFSFFASTVPHMSADLDLAAWVEHRDSQAFQRVVERHVGAVAAMCRRQLGASQEADDAVQAVFVVLARRANGLRLDAPLGPWLFGVAQRVCQHARRAAARRHRHERAAAMAHLHHDHETATESASGWEDARRHLDEAISALGVGQRMALIGHYLEGLPQAVVAQRLGISEEAIRKRLQAAREQLRQWYARRGVTVGAGVLLAGLVSEAPTAEPLLASACVQAGLHPGGAAAALANGIRVSGFSLTTGMTTWGLGVAAAVLVVTGALTVLFIGRSEVRPSPPQANDVPVPLTDPALSEEQPGPVLARQLATKITAQYRRDHLSEVLADLNDQVGLDSAAPPSIRTSTMFSYEASDVTVQSVLERLAHEQGLRITYRDNTVAIWKMADDQVIAALKKRILDPDLGARLETVFDAGQLADPRLYGILFTALAGADVDVARKALEEIELHEGSVRCQTLAAIPVESLIAKVSKHTPDELNDWDKNRILCCSILGYSRDPRASKWLLQKVETPEQDGLRVRSMCIKGLGLCRNFEAVPLLCALLADPNLDFYDLDSARQALSMIGDDRIATTIMNIYVKNNIFSTSVPIQILAQLRGPETTKALWKLADSPDTPPMQLYWVVEGLRRNNDLRIVDRLLDRLDEGNHVVEREVIPALSQFRNQMVANKLWNLLNGPVNSIRSGRILQILSAQRDPRAVSPCMSLIESSSGLDRYQPLMNLAKMRDPDLAKFLLDNFVKWGIENNYQFLNPDIVTNDKGIKNDILNLLSDSHYVVRSMALKIAFDNNYPTLRDALVELLHHPDSQIRSTAIRGLSSTHDPRMNARLIEYLLDSKGTDIALFAHFGSSEDPRSLDAVLRLIDDEHLVTFTPSFNYHGVIYAHPRIQSRLIELLKHPRLEIRRAVVPPLIAIGTPEIASALLKNLLPADWVSLNIFDSDLRLFFKKYPDVREAYERTGHSFSQASPPQLDPVPTENSVF